MKKHILSFLIFLTSTFATYAQSGNWVWLKGDSSSLGNYGTIGVSSPSNEPPARYQASYWKDLEGNFWIFGGNPGYNDLWKYSPISNEWVWMHGPKYGASMSGFYGTMGVPSVLNNPPSLGYGSNCWTDSLGDLWLYSGWNFPRLNDFDELWRYRITTNEWTWMKGDYTISKAPIYGLKGVPSDTNTPGGRAECKSAWVFNNKLWLFGGSIAGFTKNDLWSYDIATNNWTWESGSKLGNDSGNYGIKGVTSSINVPPARWSYTRWQDAENNFFLFAGGVRTGIFCNDVWQYNTSSGLWTWISGKNTFNDTETINPFCFPEVNNIPASRIESRTTQTNSICAKAFWTFGGVGVFKRTYNDLWIFNSQNLEWTKVKGGSGYPPPHSYGIKGISNVFNLPPGNFGSCVWTDKTGALFMFGGWGSIGFLNDLWKFIPDTACFRTGLIDGLELTPPSDTLLCEGDTIKIPIPLNCTVKVQPTTSNNINLVSGFIEFYGTLATKYIVIATSFFSNNPCFPNDTISFTIKGYPLPKADFLITPSKAYIDKPTFNCLNTSIDAVRYEWYYNGSLISTSKDIVQNFPTIGKHCLTLVAINKCEQRDSITKCCYVVDTTKLTSIPDTTICARDTIYMNLPIGIKIKVTPSNHYTWDSVNHNIKFYPLTTTKYTITTIQSIPNDPSFVTEDVSFTINVHPIPKALFAINPPFAYYDNPSFTFNNQSTGAVRYEWFYNGQLISTDKDITKTFSEIDQYCLSLVAINQCEQRDSITQCCKVYKKGKILIPNSFTPNNDGKNDGFRALLTGPFQSYSLIIVNRYGQEIFKTNDPNERWDGRFNNQVQELGVYYYLIKIKFDYPDAVEEMYKGDITLLR